jgi:hypothetical protein
MRFPQLTSNNPRKNKKPAGLLVRQRADEYVFKNSTYNSTGAAVGRDDDGDAPGDASKTSLLPSRSLDKPTGRVNPRRASKNRFTERVFLMFTKIDFPSVLRYFRQVLGRGADPISSRACFSDQLRTLERKG